ncbi:hypothetical protein OAV88_03155 [bacterium]|nr:hypothetical protein [bacterium]
MNSQAMNSLTLMKKNVQCPVCLDTMTNPHSLRCQHTFCKDCIIQALRHSSSCPQCRLPARPREMRHNPMVDQIATQLKIFLSASGIGSPSYPQRTPFPVNTKSLPPKQQEQQEQKEPEDPSSCTFYDVDEDMLRLEITSNGVLNLVVNDKTTTEMKKLHVHEKNGILNDGTDEPIVVKHGDIERVMLWLRVEALRRTKKCELTFDEVEDEEEEEEEDISKQGTQTQLSNTQISASPPSPPAIRSTRRHDKNHENEEIKTDTKRKKKKNSQPKQFASGRSSVNSNRRPRRRRGLNLVSNSEMNARSSSTTDSQQKRQRSTLKDRELEAKLPNGWHVVRFFFF